MIPGLACDMDEFWVFGYGSLMWNPGFEFMERAEALVYGYRRSLCVRSFVHRGTRENPGLVLGLDRGGACRGMAFRISAEKWDEVIDYLRARELVTNVYLERRVRLQLAGRRTGRRRSPTSSIASMSNMPARSMRLRRHGW